MDSVIAIIGEGRKSGKTTTMEELTKELIRRVHKVGAIKQIHEEDFSIDTPNKDTWRISEAGADIVIAAAPNEVVAIKRLQGEDRVNVALKIMEIENPDIILIEGNPSIDAPKIFAAKDPEAAKIIIPKIGDKIICISTFFPDKFSDKSFGKVYHPKKDVKKIANLIERTIKSF